MTGSARRREIDRFLAGAGWNGAAVEPLAADASFRRYLRVRRGSRTAVLMDAPPDREPIAPYAAIARHLLSLGFGAPRIEAEDRAAGLLLMEDLGDDTFTRLLARGEDETALYELAVDTLIALHRVPAATAVPPGLPAYSDDLLMAEADYFLDWYLPVIGLAAPPRQPVRLRRALAGGVRPGARRAANAGAARFPRRQPDAPRREGGARRLRAGRLPGRGGGAGELRLRVPGRGCAAGRAAGARRRAPASLPRRLSRSRRRFVRPLLRGARRPAALQGDRHLHPAVAARRKGRLSRPHRAGLAPAGGRGAAPGPAPDPGLAGRNRPPRRADGPGPRAAA